ncbi:MAG: hypothetical protein DHS20C02_18990 [Micavibrio sp.]|nr:MAG: hypothetical protein DHS20C02_18990 [Micavibrio sp.]
MSKDIMELLPFYVNGTLGGKEKDKVEQAIIDDPSLKDDLRYLEGLRREVKAYEIENSPGELGLKRLQKSLEEEKLKSDPIARARSRITSEQNRTWRMIAVAACVLLMIQTIIVAPHWMQGGTLVAAGGQSEAEISVTFAPDATESDIRGLLLGLNLNIVEGPSALGVYHLSTDDDIQQAVQALKSRDDLVESAQVEK